ncbi:hypothetical protein TrCOL_g1827 [Triparma columacea]|uniref:Uncharacterized protein n=1 Tax=Triparma columacea TaxID=722753 RepID=A0A9W7GBK7_9STRA|nr:hypothetical protein TrCOL_g1827 [Triparma columacea]
MMMMAMFLTSLFTSTIPTSALVLSLPLISPSPSHASPSISTSSPQFTSLLLLLRAEEGVKQELNLLTTGKYKTLQRANVKLAVRAIVGNYRLLDSFVKVGGGNERMTNKGQDVVFTLNTILEYFDDRNVDNIKLGKKPTVLEDGSFPVVLEEDLEPSKKKLVVGGLKRTLELFDEYFAMVDGEELERARGVVKEENELNRRDYVEFVKEDYSNPTPGTMGEEKKVEEWRKKAEEWREGVEKNGDVAAAGGDEQ